MDAVGTVQGPALLPWNWLGKRRERGRKGGEGRQYLMYFYRQRTAVDRQAEPLVGERVPYVIVCGSPGLPLIKLVRR